MPNQTTYCFWFWSPKLHGVLAMLSELSGYKLSKDDLDAIEIGLLYTNDEKNHWFDYMLCGKEYTTKLKLAYDDQEGKDMIHIQIINAAPELTPKLQVLDLFQSMFKQMELE